MDEVRDNAQHRKKKKETYSKHTAMFKVFNGNSTAINLSTTTISSQSLQFWSPMKVVTTRRFPVIAIKLNVDKATVN